MKILMFSGRYTILTISMGCLHQGEIKRRGASSNVVHCRCPLAPEDLPKSGEAYAPPAPLLGTCLVLLCKVMDYTVG